ncbi:DUF2163 domain-containing protein [Antarctobacter heliothermus]|uniref:Bacteriophage phiJL001 Gp84 C-terminal domain-containing protein n=1 Tax=Antarctobacter heliothermus TaxID=74033 RepID=A0A239L191_9RHOB|nr:DUF2163 domain-containing protein [Antarctobacter heliothermus]SNT24367.1 phage conserved hypothetical protein BR0599 [Antarctobacter heliothermus]
MKLLPTDMQAHLDDGTTTLAWCWRIERADGAIFGFTDHDRTLVISGASFEPDSGFSASEIRASADFSVDGQDAEGALRSDRITETDILDGRWDNAAIEVWRVNWEDVAQRVLMRRGNLGQIRRGKQVFVAEVRSLTHFLNQPVGRTYQYYCDAELGDARCGVNLATPSYSGSGSVALVSGDRAFRTAGLGGFAANWFALGRVEWTSGANAGRRAEVSIHSIVAGAAQITLIEAPVREITLGDGFFIQAGCDKQFATCRIKFGNGVNFRGFPAIPGDDTIVRYPTQGGGNTGQPL